MIEIIKHGVCKTTYVKSCKYCGCRFRFWEDDIISYIFSDGNDSDMINCPECNKLLFVDLTLDKEK